MESVFLFLLFVGAGVGIVLKLMGKHEEGKQAANNAALGLGLTVMSRLFKK